MKDKDRSSSDAKDVVVNNSDLEQSTIANFFEAHGVSRSYKKNEFIFRDEEESQEIYLVKVGLVKISQFAQEGQSITLFLRNAGEVFGAAEVLTGQKRQRYARCILDSQVLALPAPHFLSLIQSQPDVLYALTVSNARRLLHTQRYVETLISRPVAWRLAQFLIQLGIRKDNETHVALPLSHEETSYIIGCSRQTVTETLNRWREQGLIHYEKKHVIIYDVEHFLAHL
ncbi:cAMP-activated global transcriptional regulator CRP [Paenibacillus baekrokdamisoli]|uniref:cAMP-activated global transcriptional regulator CRP n=1 Tax=Paenibacillus baekrokdamisoli TaxID=1712516 RepID=A0A3G9IVW6_9BACL|nr:Crp/Fnr family transcriptional regulator [Paenibacillus baekrokdamisoli]MBB3067936.1 CRP-like cAMP-binding protein [Paenibacillus baekrokdamisoli]BBH23017.1 cAMP-activated global transcriptional regulator CRP [Paenibacillus baekrokdamisoli]